MLPLYLREDLPSPLAPGEPLPARAAGPGVGVVLDCIAMLLALLVFLRASVDRSWRLRQTWSVAPLALLALWALASTAWASDKFAAAVSGSAWLGAAATVFVFAQTVRTWARLRIVAGVAAGLFLACVAFGIIYRAIDLPDLIADFEENKLAFFEQRGWEPDSFAARNFEHRVRAGATGGFAASPNSFAATLVMLGFVSAALAWQRLRERSEPAWAAVLATTLIPGAYILWTTGSRTAFAALVLVAAALAIGFWRRDLLARNRRVSFAAVVALLSLGAIAVIGTGLATGTLPHESLAFRWNYWRGALGVFLENPLSGVGFANFGDAYLSHRPPVAAEEVKDPHNLFVRFFSELGLVGGALAIAWLLGFVWSQTRAALPPDDLEAPKPRAPASLQALMGLVVLGIIVHIAAGIDFTADPYYVFLELVRRGLYALLILGALLMGTIKSAQNPVVDTSPAPALLAGMLAGLSAALVHAMVDVVVFEPSVLASFAMLLGSVIGIRAPQAEPEARGRAIWPLTAAVGAGLGAYIILFAIPLLLAEAAALRGDDLVRQNRPSAALSLYKKAIDRLPVSNSNYHHRAALAIAYAQREPEEAEAALRRGIDVNPRSIAARVNLARLFAAWHPQPRFEEAAALYRQILELNPNDLQLRLEYAQVLERSGQPEAAAQQLVRVLTLNDQLDPEEPERLTPAQIEELEQRISTDGQSR